MTTSTVLLVVMSLAAIAALLYPLLAPRSRDRRVSRGPSEIDALLRRKANLYANMKDLEFEYQMGKLSQLDYERLRDEDRAEAARLLHEIESLEEGDDVDAIIEREIEARRESAAAGTARAGAAALAARPAPAPAPASAAVAASSSPRPAAFCSACGTRVRPGDRFCSACGAPIRSGDDA